MQTTDRSPHDTHLAATDMRLRWRPSEQQILVARVMLAVEPRADSVIVGIALPGKEHGIWTVGQPVRTVPGFWLAARGERTGPFAYDLAREAADVAADRRLGRRGTTSYAVISADGTFELFEGGHARPPKEA